MQSEAHTAEEPALILPPHLVSAFEKTDAQLQSTYGKSPGVNALVRLWLACATPFRINQEFERAVLGVDQSTIQPNADGLYDDDCL